MASTLPPRSGRLAGSPASALIGALLLLGLVAVAGIAYFTSRAPELPPRAVETAHLEVAAEKSAAAPVPLPTSQRAQASVLRQGAPAADAPAAGAPRVPAASADGRTELTARVREEARAQLDAYRSEIVSRCWPASGLPRGARTATLTVNVTFDAQGHEVARGVSEDRRAPAGEFARCVRRLPGIRLGVAPPGSTVAVAIPASYP